MSEKETVAVAADEDLLQPPAEGSAKPLEREPEVEAKGDDLDPPQERKPGEKRKTVPYDAMFEERERRKESEREVRDLREKHARLEERTRLILEGMQKPKEEPASVPAPDPNDNVFEAVEHDRRELAELKTLAKSFQTQQAEQAKQQSLVDAYMADAQGFAARTPDFNQAYQHYQQSVGREAQALGWTPAQVRQNEMNIVQSCFQSGRSPAEAMYELAKMRGWQPKDAQQVLPKTNGADEIKRLARAQEAAASLSGTGGGVAGAGKIDVKTLANMTSDEFSEWYAKHGEKGLAKAHGL